MKEYDLILIGGGGNLKLVGPALEKEEKIAVIEKDFLGGTCLNRGCIPSKMMIYPSEIAENIKNAGKYGIKAKYEGIKFSKLTNYIKETVSMDSNNIAKKYRKNKNIDYYKGKGKFISEKIIAIGKNKIKGKKIVIGTGSRPLIPNISGLEKTPYMTSTEALFSQKLPKKMIIIGGGYIAVELGAAYSSFNTKVTFLVRGKMISREDFEIIEEFEREFSKEHQILKIKEIKSVSYEKKIFTINYIDKNQKTRKISADALFIATGVRPNTDEMGLEIAGIKTDEKGFIKVNSNMETNISGVYAIGDCVGNYMFRHSVNFEGEYLARKFYEKRKEKINYPKIPHAIFTNPQVAGVGLTEDELIAKNIDYIKGINLYKNSAMGMALRSNSGFVKVLFDSKSRKLLGAHIIGYQASVMIHQLIFAIEMGAKIDDLNKMIYIHPALPEILRNAIRNANLEFSNRRK